MTEIATQDPDDALVPTLGMEKDVNSFFRLSSPSIVARLCEAFPELADDPDPAAVFLGLRELRNSW